jgi:hypothetical protein
MQAPDSSIARGPLTLSIRKRSGRTISVIVERGVSSIYALLSYERRVSQEVRADVSLSNSV